MFRRAIRQLCYRWQFPKTYKKLDAQSDGTSQVFKALGSGSTSIADYVTTITNATLLRSEPQEQVVKESVFPDGGVREPIFGEFFRWLAGVLHVARRRRCAQSEVPQ
ncbi:MAG: hypothetical protein ACOYOB_18485 [Myxococcota bacterium]